MSTMLKSAAMSLLSKTLQTFLYKYISDVDVEGVALPSLYDGASSGWGVRLSNVKLREGVELMQSLPGTMPRKRKRRRKSNASSQTKTNDDDGSNTKSGVDNEDREASNTATSGDDVAPMTPEKKSLDSKRNSNDHRDGVDDDEVSLELQTLTSPSLTDDEDDRPDTPVQDSKSLLSCFYTSTPRTAKAIGITKTSLHKQVTFNSLDDSLKEEPAGDHNQETLKNGLQPPQATEMGDTPSQDATITSKWSTSEQEGQSEHKRQSKPLDEEDEYEEYDQPMSLRLGHGGRIGTLDVRLVGKDLHILVEDCFLTIEAVPIVPPDDDSEENENSNPDGGSKESASQGENGKEETAKASTSQSKSATPSKGKVPEPSRNTVGDRVFAENALARAISAIPHLFLRDIRVRLIVRDEAPPAAPPEEAGTTEGSPGLDPSLPSPADTQVEFAVEFLSVTSGEDVLSHFQPADEESFSNTLEDAAAVGVALRSNPKPPMNSIPSFASVDSSMGQNEYLVRHIRTGRGPEGGLWLRIIPPQANLTRTRLDKDFSSTWAWNCWLLATESYFFRCSGVDIRARIHLGTKKEVARYSWFYDDYDDDDNEEYDEDMMDSMLWSVDYVAPGPQLPFPPVSPHMSRGSGGTPLKDQSHSSNAVLQADPYGDQQVGEEGLVYQKDCNGIQSCSVPSCFHRVGRGMIPGSCKGCDHLPCDTCSNCWELPPNGGGVSHDNPLDYSLPMPGLVLQFTIREPLELNVERKSLESVGLLQCLFTKKSSGMGAQGKTKEAQGTSSGDTEQGPADAAPPEEATHTTASSTSPPADCKDLTKEDSTEAFPTYMQPEHIQVIGIHLAKILVRVHVMRKFPASDQGLSFCYWDIDAKCVNLDFHSLSPPLGSSSSEHMSMQDVRFDVGHFALTEYKGLNSHQLVLLGLRHEERNRNRCDSSVSTVSLDCGDDPESPWPSTASAVLEIPPPPETHIYQSRQCHGLQLRFVSVNTPSPISTQNSQNFSARSMVNVRLGATSIDMPLIKSKEVNMVRAEAMKCVFGSGFQDSESARSDHSDNSEQQTKPSDEMSSPENKTQGKSATESRIDSLLRYKIQIDSGTMSIPPLVNVRLPLTKISGERSSESGIFMETMLNHFQCSYGAQYLGSITSRKRLSLIQLASVPENVRLRVLMFLDDLKPLEQALKVKKESNHFMRYRTVNKGIVNVAKRLSAAATAKSREPLDKRKTVHSGGDDDTNDSRRRKLMTELLQLSNEELEQLFAIHRKNNNNTE